MRRLRALTLFLLVLAAGCDFFQLPAMSKPSVLVSPTSGLTTTKDGGTATFTVRLATAPTANVTIGLTSSRTDQGTVAPATLTFTSANWSSPQTVTVTGVDDHVAGRSVAYTVVTAPAVSTDPAYSGMDPPDVSVTNVGNDVPGFAVTPTSGLVTTEAGGTATFTVRLLTRPTANVTIGLTSSRTDAGTVAPASLTFTPASWDQQQTVTVTGVNAHVAGGSVAYVVVTAPAVSADPAYSGLDPPDVSVTNLNTETPGINVTPTAGLTTTETGGKATFTIVLATQPKANVTIGLTSSDTTQGTVSPSSVTFTPADWSSPQTVTVTGVSSNVAGGSQAYTVVTAPATSTDPSYSGLDAPDVSVTNQHDLKAGITVAPTSGLTTTETGGSATFTIVLDTRPSANVTIGLTSSDTTQGTVAPSSVTFTPASWNAPQTVTVTGVSSNVAGGSQQYTVVTAPATSADPAYAGLDAADVSVTNQHNLTAGITVTPTSGLTTTVAGGTASFTIQLATRPAAAVTIGVSSSDPTRGTPAPVIVTLTDATWNVPQTVTVTGGAGAGAYTILLAPAGSADPAYSGLNPGDVSVTNAP
jgi:hypothetical protein